MVFGLVTMQVPKKAFLLGWRPKTCNFEIIILHGFWCYDGASSRKQTLLGWMPKKCTSHIKIAWFLVVQWHKSRNQTFFRGKGQQNVPHKLNYWCCDGASSQIGHSLGWRPTKNTPYILLYCMGFVFVMAQVQKLGFLVGLQAWNEDLITYKLNIFLHMWWKGNQKLGIVLKWRYCKL